MIKRALIVMLSCLAPGCVLVSGSFSLFHSAPEPLEEHVVSGEGRDAILLVDISNVIQSQDDRGTFGMGGRESTTARIAAELEKAAEDDHVRAVVLRINSPGGTVTASDMVFQQLIEFKRERHLPVVAHFMDVAASGGYYVALAADEIIASPTTVTGSIGVVMYGLNFEGLMEKLGVKNQTITSGRHKDIGSPLRVMEPEDRAILQSVVDDMKDRFFKVVRAQRPTMSPDAISTLSDGRVVSASQALDLGLVDALGYLPDAIERARIRAGVERARVIRYTRSQEYAESIFSKGGMPPVQMSLIGLDRFIPAGPNFFYLWLPTVE